MTRRRRIALWVAGSLGVVVVLIVAIAIIVAQSSWFAGYVRDKIIAVTEESTGGKVDLASFEFDWTHLRATLRNFVIHGTEPPGSAPLFRAKSVMVELKLLASLKQYIDIRTLDVDTPQANVIIFPDGSTNVPAPKIKKKPSDKSPLETVVDLAVGKFNLHDGYLALADRKTPINAQGQNLRAMLDYNTVARSYSGTIDINPLKFQYGGKEPLDISVHLPVVLERDRISLNDGKVYTPQSALVLNASMTDMKEPKTTARLNGKIALAELRRVVDVKISPQAGKTLPGFVDVDFAANIDRDRIQLSSARLTLGGSSVEASGTLKDPSGNGAVQYRATLNASEVGRLFELPQRPEGMVQANGNLKLTAAGYETSGNISGRGISFTQSGTRYRNIALNSAFYADPKKIALSGLKLDAFGGEFAGNAEVADMKTVKLAGNLRHFDLNSLSSALTGKPLGYGGVVSGPVEVNGDLTKPGATGFNAKANLAITATRGGVPVSGRLNATYSGATNNVELSNSYLQLPNTRLALTGSLGRAIQVNLTTHNLNDLLPLLHGAKLPVELARNGSVSFDGTISGSTSTPRIAGHLTLVNFAVEGREFDRLTADLNANPSGAAVQNASLLRGPMRTDFAAQVGLKNWKPEPYEPLRATATIANGDLADVLALAGQKGIDARGALSAQSNINGTIGNPVGSATLNVANGQIEGEPFDRITAQVNLADQLITVPSATMVAGPSHIDLSARFQHPRDSFATGTLTAHVASNQVQLSQFKTLLKQRPGLSGVAQVNADVAAELLKGKTGTEFRLTSVNGDASVRGLAAEGQNYGDLTATARTAGDTVTYRVNSDFAGSTINVAGSTRLVPDYPTDATAHLANLPVERVLALANKSDIAVRGNLSGDASFRGTLANPQGSADVTLAKAVIEGEPVDRMHARVNYTPAAIDLPLFEAVAGPSRVAGSANYTHVAGDFQNGNVRFQIDNSTVQLGNLHTVQAKWPGLSGAVQLAAAGAAAIRPAKNGADVQIASVNADINAANVQMNGKNFGDLKLTATTRGDRAEYKLDSDFAGAGLHGTGSTVLRGDYPTTAQVAFTNLRYSTLKPFLPNTTATPSNWDLFAQGQATVNGPLKRVDDLSADLQLTRLEIANVPPPGSTTPRVAIVNDGPVTLAVNKSVVTVQRAHLTGPDTDINITGTAALTGTQALNVDVKANTNLSVLQQMTRNIYSSGVIAINAGVRGTMKDPAMTGTIALRDASFNYIDFPNGISHANGVIALNGTSATIQNLTAESGGGAITASGSFSFAEGALGYDNLHATARRVRVRYPQGASAIVSANVSLNGTADRSALTGTATINQIGFAPQSDVGAFLTRGSAPATAPAAPSGPLAGMRLDVRIRTAAGANFVSPMAQNIDADADLTLRGTAANPGMLGRVNITAGDLVFFGNKYTVRSGSVAFYDPFRIRPILDINLETIAKGVDVVLTVAGPIDNMKLTYHSDPPLQFQEVVALLATGRTPTSDPTIVANQPAQPPQTFQQMGESAIVSRAIANPVANRLERVFGVSQLKIDPTFTSGSELPQARLTLQQQVAPSVTFTYITNLSETNSQIYRVEWAVNPNWSAIATREENGRFGLDIFYKKKIR